MAGHIGIVDVPFRFEGLRELVGDQRLSHVLLEMPDDLTAVKRILVSAASARQGKLAFLLGSSGSGKTSLVYSLPVFLADLVGHILTPPADYSVPLTTLPNWLAGRLPQARAAAGGKTIVVCLDQRETLPARAEDTRAALTNLNALLRNERDVVALWPVASAAFTELPLAELRAAGGGSALADPPVVQVRGLLRNQYFDALRLILDATSVRLDDAAITRDEVEAVISRAITIGDCLEQVHKLVVDRYEIGDLGLALPRVYVVVTSNEPVATACRLLCRGLSYLVDPDRLLKFSRANVADDWRARGQRNPRQSLAFVASLFEARLVFLTDSAVVNACALSPDPAVKAAVVARYPEPKSMNAENALRNSALVRALDGNEDVGASAARSGEPVRQAYQALQALTQTKHRPVNEAVMAVVARLVERPLAQIDYEYQPVAGAGLRADVWIRRNDRPEAIEFTHRAAGRASEAVVASYVLTKLQDYARDYGLLQP